MLQTTEPKDKSQKNQTFYLSPLYTKALDSLVELGIIPSKSEGIRLGVKNYINSVKKEIEMIDCLGKKSKSDHSISTALIPRDCIEEIKKIEKEKLFYGVSEFIRESVKRFLVKEYMLINNVIELPKPTTSNSNNIKISNGNGTFKNYTVKEVLNK